MTQTHKFPLQLEAADRLPVAVGPEQAVEPGAGAADPVVAARPLLQPALPYLRRKVCHSLSGSGLQDR